MAKPNYQFEKRQRELAKKAKKAEKAARKASGEPEAEDESVDQALADSGSGGVAAEPASEGSPSDASQSLPKA